MTKYNFADLEDTITNDDFSPDIVFVAAYINKTLIDLIIEADNGVIGVGGAHAHLWQRARVCGGFHVLCRHIVRHQCGAVAVSGFDVRCRALQIQ